MTTISIRKSTVKSLAYASIYTAIFWALSMSAHAQPITLDAAIKRAQSATPAIAARGLQVEAARSASIAADQLPDPKLSVDLLGQRIAGPHAVSPRPGRNGFPRQRIGISQAIPNGATRRARAERAKANITLARANKTQAVYQLDLLTAEAWTNLYYAEKRLKILDVLQQSLTDLSKTVGARLESGSSRPAQAFEPERLIAQLDDRRSLRNADIEKSRAHLARWIGLDKPQIEGAPPEIEFDRAALMERIEALPILGIQAAMVERAEAEVQLARARKRPDFAVNAAFSHRRPEYGEYVSVGVTIGLPLFAKKRQNPLIHARMLEADAARLEAEDLRQQLKAELSADLSVNQSHQENWERSKRILLPLAKKQAELERISYSAGRVDLATALHAAVDFAEVEIDLLGREATLVRDKIRIKFTYAGGL